jgi:hypothetical protein
MTATVRIRFRRQVRDKRPTGEAMKPIRVRISPANNEPMPPGKRFFRRHPIDLGAISSLQ